MRFRSIACLALILTTSGLVLPTALSAKDVGGFPGAKAVMRAGPFEAVYEGRQRGLYPDWYLDGMRTVAASRLNEARTLSAGDTLHTEELRLQKKTIRLTEPLPNVAKNQGVWTVGTTFDLYGNLNRGSYCRTDYTRNQFNVPAGFYCLVDSDRDGRMDMMRFKENKKGAMFDFPVQIMGTPYEDAGPSEETAWKRDLVIHAIDSEKVVVAAPILDWVVVREELQSFPQFRARLETGETDLIDLHFNEGQAVLAYEGAQFKFSQSGADQVSVVRTSNFSPWAETVRGRGVALIETRFPAGQ